MLNYNTHMPPNLTFKSELGVIECRYREYFGYRFDVVVNGIKFCVFTETSKHDEVKEVIRIFAKWILLSYNLNIHFDVKYFNNSIVLVKR